MGHKNYVEIQSAIDLIKYDGLWPTHGGGKSRGYRGDNGDIDNHLFLWARALSHNSPKVKMESRVYMCTFSTSLV